MGQLDASIVSLAFPTLSHQFNATLGAVQWVGLAYLLVLVSTVTALGRVADGVGRKLLYTYGFVVFIIGSAACGLAPDLLVLDVFRGVQALGAAMMQANSVAIIALAVPRHQLGRGIGVQGAAQALGLSLGPAVGGALIALGGWRMIFFVNVPIGIVGTAAAWILIPRSRDLERRQPFDWVGLALFVPAVCALLLTISFGNQLDWSSLPSVGLLSAVVLLGTAFVGRERLARSPMLDLRLFARSAFSAGISSGLLAYLVLFGALFAIPFLLERDHNLSPAAAGATLTALPVALGIIAPFAGRVADRLGPRLPTVAGMGFAAVALVLLARFHHHELVLLGELAFLGAGLGAFIPANNAAIMSAAPRMQSGAVAGILNFTRGLGTALGLALTALVIGRFTGPHAQSHLIAKGFTAGTVFLAAVALIASILACLRGGTRFVIDEAQLPR